MAIDCISTNTDSLVALLTQAGLFWAGPSDPVHFSMLGPKDKVLRARGEGRKFDVPTLEEWQMLNKTGKYSIGATLKRFGITPEKIVKAILPG
jgi:hypothetical protein